MVTTKLLDANANCEVLSKYEYMVLGGTPEKVREVLIYAIDQTADIKVLDKYRTI